MIFFLQNMIKLIYRLLMSIDVAFCLINKKKTKQIKSNKCFTHVSNVVFLHAYIWPENKTETPLS